MPSDPDDVLDALAAGLSIPAAAAKFGLSEAEVRSIRKAEADRLADGEEIRQQYALADRRLLAMELKFHEKALAEMDATSAVIALKANERRANLHGGGSAQPSHLIAVMTAKAQEQAPTSTQRLRASLDNVLGITYQERQLLDRRDLEGDNSPEVLAGINQFRAARGKPPLDDDKQD